MPDIVLHTLWELSLNSLGNSMGKAVIIHFTYEELNSKGFRSMVEFMLLITSRVGAEPQGQWF